MSDTILLVGHGSRGPDGNRETDAFAAEWAQRRPDLNIITCYIEYAERLLPEGLELAAQSGCARVIVVPLILNAAGHVKLELPEQVKHARKRYPGVEFIIAPHLGPTQDFLKLLKRRLQSAMQTLDMPDPRNTGVILLGRGSSDMQANGEVAKMARWLYESTEHDLVDIAFTGITHPRLETAVQRQIRLGSKQVIILPYYLFTGRLIERIRNQVARLSAQYPDCSFVQGDYFANDDAVFGVLETRLAEAQSGEVVLNCDGCPHAESAAESHHHHHHHH